MTADTIRLLGWTQKSTALQRQGLTGHFWTLLRGFMFFISLPVTLWNPSQWEHSLRLYGWRQLGPPHRVTAHWRPSSHLSPFGFCAPLRRGSLTVGSCVSCTCAEMGNKRIKRTHWGKKDLWALLLNNMDEGFMSPIQMIGHRKSWNGQHSL